MAGYVLVEVRFLGESHGAACEISVRADEGPFPSMNSKVIIEVMKLPEELKTAWVVAFQDLKASVGLRVPVFDDPKISRAGGH